MAKATVLFKSSMEEGINVVKTIVQNKVVDHIA